MRILNKIIHLKVLYIYFIFLSLNIFFFSTVKLNAKSFDIENIDISRPFKIDFNKNDVIDEGFEKAFFELLKSIVNSSDLKKIDKIDLKKVKGMIESFTIKEEKFIKEIYYVNLGVSFNRKKIFNYLEENNVFPSAPLKKKFLFIPIIIDQNSNDLLIFNKNKIFNEWNKELKSYHLVEYILPTEDLEDINIIKSKNEFIEEYDFKEITDKYNLENSIIALIFKDKKKIRILSRITNKKDVLIKNQSFSNLDLDDNTQVNIIIDELKLIYEDYWKASNQINTSIKLNLDIKINNSNYLKISNFEKILEETDLIYNYFISKFDQNFTEYKIIFNGTPDTFLNSMNDKKHSFDTQNKIWILK
jgi:hypothetical protein